MYSQFLVHVLLSAVVFIRVDAGAKKLKNEPCYPRPTIVATDDTRHRHFPYFITLYRCAGSVGTNSPAQKRCVAKEITEVEVLVVNSVTPLPNKGQSVKLENHTSCTSECTIKASDCENNQKYNERTCECECPYEKAPKSCGPNKYWSKFTCSCECEQRNSCPRKMSWSSKTCGCICSAEYGAQCSEGKKILDPRTCTCRDPKIIRIGSTKNGEGKGLATQSFWYYVVIGEFIVLMVLFDAVLFCKKSGVVYSLTKNCRSKDANLVAIERNGVPIDYCCVGKHAHSSMVNLDGSGNVGCYLYASKVNNSLEENRQQSNFPLEQSVSI